MKLPPRMVLMQAIRSSSAYVPEVTHRFESNYDFHEARKLAQLCAKERPATSRERPEARFEFRDRRDNTLLYVLNCSISAFETFNQMLKICGR